VVKIGVLGLLILAAFVVLALAPSARPRSAEATANPLPPLIACPNLDASTEAPSPPDPAKLGKVSVVDILTVVTHYGKSYGQSGYEYLWDPVSPYNNTSSAGTGSITVADILYVVTHYGNTCPLMETQIATATRAIADPTFTSKLCDGTAYVNDVNCGGDPQFLTEDPSFLASRGYHTTSIDVPGQGVHYGSFLGDDVFNPVRPEALVYKGGKLVAQLYYAEGDVVGWGPDRNSNKHAVNTDALPCAPSSSEPPGIGCSWDGTYDGWHWHDNICIVGIGTSNSHITRLTSQSDCATWGSTTFGITCVFPPAPNPNCVWRAALGWMSHLWNWLPNANYTNAVNPGPGGLNLCQTAYCNTTEPNGRFADCFPDVSGWNAYNCPS